MSLLRLDLEPNALRRMLCSPGAGSVRCQVVLAAISAEGGASHWQGLCPLTDLKGCNIALGQVEHTLSHHPSQFLK